MAVAMAMNKVVTETFWDNINHPKVEEIKLTQKKKKGYASVGHESDKSPTFTGLELTVKYGG